MVFSTTTGCGVHLFLIQHPVVFCKSRSNTIYSGHVTCDIQDIVVILTVSIACGILSNVMPIISFWRKIMSGRSKNDAAIESPSLFVVGRGINEPIGMITPNLIGTTNRFGVDLVEGMESELRNLGDIVVNDYDNFSPTLACRIVNREDAYSIAGNF